MLSFHGGGWVGNLGARADTAAGWLIAEYTKSGYRTFNVGYRTHHSLEDATEAFDEIRARHPYTPICTSGVSAGAQLALAVAWRRSVDCVIAISGPPDLLDWGHVPYSYAGRKMALAAFGERAGRLSPMHHVDELDQPILVVAARCDQMIGFAEQRRFSNRLRRGSLVRLHPGGSGYALAHCSNPMTRTTIMERRTRRLLDRISSAGTRGAR
jgi:acetyl esterase/lipase